jgi:hypothetical protein
MGDCASPGARWLISGGTIASAVVPGAALDIDCNAKTPHTIAKVLMSGPSALTLRGGAVEFGSSGMCLNTGQGPARPPCGPPGEVWLPHQIQLVDCSDPTALGWEVA